MVLSLLPLLYWRDIVLEAELKMQMYNMLDLSFIRQSDKTNTISSFLVFYAIVQWIFVNLINSGKCCLWDCWKDFEIWLIDWFLQKFSFECEPGRSGTEWREGFEHPLEFWISRTSLVLPTRLPPETALLFLFSFFMLSYLQCVYFRRTRNSQRVI